VPGQADKTGACCTGWTVAKVAFSLALVAAYYARRGPIVERPGSRTPLLMAEEGTGLTLLAIEGEWFKVEYTDRTPPFRRVGYIHVQYMRANASR